MNILWDLHIITTLEQYCFFTIQTIFHDISIWCNISRYFHDIFQALNWSKICVISSKICPGSAYVEIFCDKNAVFCVLRQKWPILYLFAKKVADLKCKVWCQFITNIWQMRYNSKEEPIRLTHVNTQLNWWIAFVNWSMKGQKWLISCIKKYRKNIVISSGIAIFSDVSKRCNILLSRYIAIQNAHPWL